jgi:hypothetical protein
MLKVPPQYQLAITAACADKLVVALIAWALVRRRLRGSA